MTEGTRLAGLPTPPSHPCRVAIVGSRSCPEWVSKYIKQYVNDCPEGTIIVSGGAKGPDSWAESAANLYGKETDIYPADWDNINAPGAVVKHGQYGPYNARAGYDRNQDIVDNCDMVVAFIMDEPGRAPTSGTADTIRRARGFDERITGEGQQNGISAKGVARFQNASVQVDIVYVQSLSPPPADTFDDILDDLLF